MAAKKETHSEEVSIISGGVKLEGNLYSEGNVRIDGNVVGNVTVNGNLTVGDGSEIKGEIKAKNVTVSGKIEGEIKATNIVMGGRLEGKVTASDSLRLEAKCVLKGDLITRKLIIEEGALFDGYSSMNNTNRSAHVKHDNDGE